MPRRVTDQLARKLQVIELHISVIEKKLNEIINKLTAIEKTLKELNY